MKCFSMCTLSIRFFQTNTTRDQTGAEERRQIATRIAELAESARFELACPSRSHRHSKTRRLPFRQLSLYQTMVGATGFEPATPCSPSRCATGLRYAPTKITTEKRWSEYKDLNLGPSGPKPDALPGCATLRRNCGHYENGRDGGIRTRDPLLPKQVRYQTALHPGDRTTKNGGERGIRTLVPLRAPVFEAGALDQLGQLSRTEGRGHPARSG
jgi:hypothetical protein